MSTLALPRKRDYSRKKTAAASGRVPFSASLITALVGATTFMGPAFTTQTAMFSAQYRGAFFAVILTVLLIDLFAQGNIYRIICFSGKHIQDIADELHPGLGRFLAYFMSCGICIYQFANVAGSGLGLHTLTGLNQHICCIIMGAFTICLLLSKSLSRTIGIVARILAGVLISVSLIVSFLAKPPLSAIPFQIAQADPALLILPVVTLIGTTCGGHAPYITTHRLLDEGICHEKNYYLYKRTQFLAALTSYTVRILLFLCAFGAVMEGAAVDMLNPAPSVFRAVIGLSGYRLYGLVLMLAGLMPIMGGTSTLCTLIEGYHPWIRNHRNIVCVTIILVCTVTDVFAGSPVNLMTAACALNSIVLPAGLIICLFASRRESIMGKGYRHPRFLTAGGIAVTIIGLFVSLWNLPALVHLFA